LDDTASPNRKIAFVMRNSAGTDQVLRSSSALAAGTWYHIAGVYNGTQMLLYLNGVQSGTPITMTPVSSSLTEANIGAHSGHDQNWNGTIDEVRISSAARSAAWIKFEYYNIGEEDNELSWGDTTAPTVSALSPADNATGVSTTANLVITFDEAVDPEAGAANDITIKKTSDDSTVETIDAQDAKVTGGGTTTITINPAATLNEGTEYYVLIGADAFDDAASNSYAGISSTTAWSFTTADTTGPVILGTAATAGSAGADITWSTNEDASSQVQYGTTEAFGSTTAETDTGTRVQAHSVTLSGLPSCTRYFYRPVSRDASANASTGSTLNFTTTGCTNSASVSSQTGSSIPTGGGSLSMTNGGSGASLTVPASASTNVFTLQIKKIDKATVIAETSTPSGTSTIGDHTYDIRAISGSTLVTSFLQPITVTMEYTDDQVNGYTENSLWIFRWDGSAWNALSGCSVDTAANTVTCTTTHFSAFGLFGTAISSSETTQSTGTQGSGGRRGSTQDMAARIASARTAILARYDGKRRASATLAASQQSSSSSPWGEQLAAEREREISARIAERQERIAEIEKTKKEFEQKFALRREERMARAMEEEQKNLDEAKKALLAEQEELKAEQEANAKKRKERIAARETLDAQESRKGAAESVEAVAARRDRLYAVVNEMPVLFADVPLSAWFAPYVSYAVEEKIATGYADADGKPKGEFGVANPVTYAEVLKMALRAANKDAVPLPPPRNASAQGTWASPFVAQAESLGLSLFTPSLNVHMPAPRGAVIQTILEVIGLPIADQDPAFSDVPPGHLHASAIATAAFYGLIGGDTDAQGIPLNTFRPDAPITRAEVAKIIAVIKETIR